jgi:hypothetical protein
MIKNSGCTSLFSRLLSFTKRVQKIVENSLATIHTQLKTRRGKYSVANFPLPTEEIKTNRHRIVTE